MFRALDKKEYHGKIKDSFSKFLSENIYCDLSLEQF